MKVWDVRSDFVGDGLVAGEEPYRRSICLIEAL